MIYNLIKDILPDNDEFLYTYTLPEFDIKLNELTYEEYNCLLQNYSTLYTAIVDNKIQDFKTKQYLDIIIRNVYQLKRIIKTNNELILHLK